MLEGCITSGGDGHTRAAILRFKGFLYYDSDREGVSPNFFGKAYHERQAAGCKWCGKKSRFGNSGLCRRCYQLRPALRNAAMETIGLIPFLLEQPNRKRREEIKCLKQGKKTLLQIRKLLNS